VSDQRPSVSVAEAVERVGDAFFTLDEEWRFTYLNDRTETMLGRSRDRLLGEVFWDEFPETAETQFPRGFHRAMETQEPVNVEFYHESQETYFEARVYPSESGLTVSLRDVTERRERKRDLLRHRRIVQSISVGVVAIEADDSIGFVNSTVADAVGDGSADLVGAHLETLIDAVNVDGEDAVELGHALDQLRRGDAEQRRLEVEYALAEDDTRIAEVQLALLDEARVVGVIRDVTESRRFERVVTSLHSVTPELLNADGQLEVASVAVYAAGEVLDLRVAGVWLIDDERNRLAPVAGTAGAYEELGGLPHFPRGEGVVWRAFRDGDPAVYDDVRDFEGHNDDTPLRSQIVVPVGDHGVLMAGETTTDAFEGPDLELATILGANTEAALDRTERDQQLRRSKDTVERQTERLEAVERALSETVQEQLALATRRVETADVEAARALLDRARRATADAAELAHGDLSVRPRAPIEVGEAAVAAAERVEGVTVEIDQGGWLRADRERLLHLLETLYVDARRRTTDSARRTAETAVAETNANGRGDDVSADGAGGSPEEPVSVRVRAGADGTLRLVDDAAPIPAERRASAFDLGRIGRDDGVDGLGLAVAGEIAVAHGWDPVATVEDGENCFLLREVTTLNPIESGTHD